MQDILPFPNITAGTPQEQASQINNYLIQLKESIEFALVNISTENLAPDLAAQMERQVAAIKSVEIEQQEQKQQVAKKVLTVSDVVNSEMFKAALKAVEEKIPTEYIVSVKETVEEAKDTYSFTDAGGKVTTITITKDVVEDTTPEE